MLGFGLLFGFTCVLCLLLTPLVRRLAIRYGQVDNPDGVRKMHSRPIPLAGGIAILISSIVALIAIQALGWSIGNASEEEWTFLAGLLASSIFICTLGVVDDRVLLRGRYKLGGQLIAVGILVASGVVVRSFNLFGTHVELGILAIPFTVMWLLGAINSLNLIDGMDGLLSSIGLIICCTLALMAITSGHTTTAFLAITLAGALAGFLCFNFPPASVFLGDAGSMLIGLVIGVLSIHGSLKGPAAVALSVPIAVLTIPFFDTLAAIARRKLTGKSIYFADREHLHHCLLRRGFSSRRTLLCVSCFCLLTAAGAMTAVVLQNETVALLTTVAAIGLLVTTRLFGYSEFLLLKKHLVVAATSLLSLRMTRDHHAIEIRFHGSADWAELWSKLAEAGTENELATVVLDVNAAAGKERYHARWSSVRTKAELIDQWHANVPLYLEGRVAGRLQVVGQGDSQPIAKQLMLLAELVDDLEVRLSDILSPFESSLESTGDLEERPVFARLQAPTPTSSMEAI